MYTVYIYIYIYIYICVCVYVTYIYIYICMLCIYIYIYICYLYIRVKTPLSRPQCQNVNYIMRSITLHTTSGIYIYIYIFQNERAYVSCQNASWMKLFRASFSNCTRRCQTHATVAIFCLYFCLFGSKTTPRLQFLVVRRHPCTLE